MPKISEMQKPALPLSGLEMLPVLQGGGLDANVGVPLLAYGGLPTGSVLRLRNPMSADLSATADADPGAGKVRWNNAAPGSATVLYVNDADLDSADMSAAFASLIVGGFLYVQASEDSERRDTWQKWQATSITDASDYTKVGVTLVASNGAFVADEDVEVTIQQPTPVPGTPAPSIQTLTSASTITPVATNDLVSVSALAVNATIANPTGTASEVDGFVITIKDDGTARTLTWGSNYVGMDGAPVAKTTAGKLVDIPVRYSAILSKWLVYKPSVQA